jgi:hypothetical protein
VKGSRNVNGAISATRKRRLKVAPVTRAVRSALAVSAAAFALAGSGAAFAGDCTAPAGNTIRCNGDFADTLNFAVEDLTLVVGDEAPTTISPAGGNAGILADWAGAIGVVSSADITTYGADGIDAVGSGDISVESDGSIDAAGPGQTIGIYAYSDGGDVTVANGGAISAYSYGGLADGIFASGAGVDVSNAGTISASGYDWAAGIEAQGTGATNVSNDGAISAYAYVNGGYAFGIYAGGDDVTVANGGGVDVLGYNASGLYAQSSGAASIDNAGTIGVQGVYSTGIHAASSGLDSVVSATSGGSVNVYGYAGATGIEALATGEGSNASAGNSGDIYVNSVYKYAGGSAGVVASADGDASVDNSGGIEAVAGGSAYGAMALSFNGDASVVSSGDISATSTAFLYYGAFGIVAASQNGSASVDNSGGITIAASLNGGRGIDVEGFAGATATNSGAIDVDAKYAYGVFAKAGDGDVSVTNEAGGAIDAYSGVGYATGMFGYSGGGDTVLSNDGTIASDGYSQSVGLFARAAQGDATASNTGSISSYAYYGAAVGIYANAPYGTVTVSNVGDIAVTGPGAYGVGVAFGVLADGASVAVSNDGDISATGYILANGIDARGDDLASVSNTGSVAAVALGNATGISAASGDGAVSVQNDGEVQAGSLYLDAIGIYAYSQGDVEVSNSGYVQAVALAGLADGIFAAGANASVDNAAGGLIVAVGYDWAAGIEAQGSDSVSVSSAGDIAVQTYGASEAFGIYAAGGEGGATVDNSGKISVHGYDQATGIYARAAGDVGIANSGKVYAGYLAYDDYGNPYSSSYALALFGVASGDGAAVDIENSGLLQAISFEVSSGVEARALGADGSANVANSGDVTAVALSSQGSAAGLVAAADGDATIANDGTVLAYSGGMAYGALAVAFNGDASVTNSGDIQSINTAFPYYSAYGVVSSSQNGGASADNSGTIYAYSPYIGVGMQVSAMTGASVVNSGDIDANAWISYGIRATSGQGDVSVDNSGTIDAHYTGYYVPRYAFGIYADSAAGDVAVDNGGDITSAAGRQAFGIFASSTSGDITVDSSGSIVATADSSLAAPIFATNSGGDVSIDNSGSLQGYANTGAVAGAFARATQGTASITNSGDIGAVSEGTAYGVLVRGYYAEAHNSGDIAATGAKAFGAYVDATIDGSIENSGGISASTDDGLAVGAYAFGLYGASVSNSGDISASAGADGVAVGVLAQAYYDVLVENSGSITASHPDVAVAVQMYSAAGTATLDNSGTISTDTSVAGSIALLGSYGANVVNNNGDIHGAIVTFDADDQFANGQGGTWHVGNYTTSFGGGDDAIENGAGGTIHLADGAISLGSSGEAGNSFQNDGTLLTSDFGLIDMGTGPASLVPSLNPLPLVNDGVISFVDGAPNDMLVILGDLGGDGAIDLDVSQLNGTGDLLYVDGSVVDGASQAINLNIDGVPTALHGDMAPVVQVTGNVPANAFTGGQVLNIDPSNFLAFGISVGTAQSGNITTVSAGVDVTGLNDTGVLAASVAQGAQNLVNSAIGTLRQRTGVLYPLDDGQAGISPWVRYFTDKGDVAPDATGFGSGADFGFEQENSGTEFGIDFGVGNGFHIGLLGGNADGKQRLDGAQGSDRLKLHGAGVYASWYGSRFYVDVSQRWMDFDARLDSAAGERDASGNATATNIEAGLSGWSAFGIDVVPQVQYTRTKIDNVGPVAGSLTQMDIDGGASERGRVGVALSRTFPGSGGFSWTPYGALSAVREFDGETGFTVADAFSGTTSAEGTSTLAELGIGVHNGHLSATAGFNWADGGAVDNARGGQLVVRYTW